MGNHTGPITLSAEKPRKQLVEHGEVVTFRSERTTGDTWWHTCRTCKKEGDVHVEEIGPADPSDIDQLEPYGHKSGFISASEWRSAISEIHGGLDDGYLYRVTKR